MTQLSSSMFGEKDRTVEIRPGLEVVYGDFRLRESRQFHFKNNGNACAFVFVLSGSVMHHFADLGKNVVIPSGHAALLLVPQLFGIHECGADEDIRFVCVHMHRSLLAETIQADIGRLPPLVRGLIENRENGFYHDISAMSDQMQEVAQQFFTCPYEGTAETLFLEGKALELVSHFMASLLEPDHDAGLYKGAPEDDRIQHAQRILMDLMVQPPSLAELGNLVGLSQASLTRGVRKTFGMPVFQFLRDRRLEKARVLLESTEMSVTEVAYSVGFSGPSHLTRLFNKQFGVNPGAYRRANRPQQ